MKLKTAKTYMIKRRKLLIERNHSLIERLKISKTIRELNKELNGIDNLIIQNGG